MYIFNKAEIKDYMKLLKAIGRLSFLTSTGFYSSVISFGATHNIRFFVEKVVGAVKNAVSGFRSSLDGPRSEQNATSSLLTQGKDVPIYTGDENE
ncbi:uncharacterized protein LOC143225456 isoform X2 [Tachypleus tridentatus]|uniref:uncharacterized protein LOC143225456 isoform X2 n=1 Tax=Tachypleus tridentatus TaxID=6853 RepID=UPI003FD68EEA